MAHDSIGRVGSVRGCMCPSCELSQNTEQALHEGIQTARKHRAADPTTHANDGLINLCLHRSLDNTPTSNTLTQVELGHMPGEGCSNMQTRARSCRKGCRDLMIYCLKNLALQKSGTQRKSSTQARERDSQNYTRTLSRPLSKHPSSNRHSGECCEALGYF